MFHNFNKSKLSTLIKKFKCSTVLHTVLIGCLENDDLENDDSDGIARRIKGLEGYRGREIRGR